jgi:nucleotide-binding universal stress UspA family protein
MNRILVATDESADGRHAVSIARQLASKAGVRLTILRVVALPPTGEIPPGRIVSTDSQDTLRPTDGHDLDRFLSWLGPDVIRTAGEPAEVAVAFGVPGIEIGRMADLRESSLIVLGRRPRTPDRPLLLGETADALVRRSQRPVLAVPEKVGALGSVLAALDGTDRCIQVLDCARCFSVLVGGPLGAVTVEPLLADEEVPGVDVPRRGRSLKVRQLLYVHGRTAASTPLSVRQGNAIEEILAEVETVRPSVLTVGYRRGGPPKRFGPTEVARNLLYAAPCAVLTVPL